ncbi:hypothetical protein EVAR_21593_1 [Eumeta japonica]|uniref:Uncharacterized protein n=1 Tax=Eumeta variegata TaxID=151549 RepID=A0A4C1UXH8_EUMVA|nr:hypothetical protein EVAR_21593_1 [Eumeta japonica]
MTDNRSECSTLVQACVLSHRYRRDPRRRMITRIEIGIQIETDRTSRTERRSELWSTSSSVFVEDESTRCMSTRVKPRTRNNDKTDSMSRRNLHT